MYSIKYPDMVNNLKTNLVSDHQATYQNTYLLLKSIRTTLFGDPYFGTNLHKMLFEQNSVLIQDLIIDEIYTCITTFLPQLQLSRNDITVQEEAGAITANIKCTNLIDYTTDLYKISLTE